MLYTDPAGRLGQVENFPPGQALRFGNLEYAMDSPSELVFSGWVSDHLKNRTDVITHELDLILERAHDEKCPLDPAMSLDSSIIPPIQASSLLCEDPEVVSCHTPARLQVSSAYCQKMDRADLSTLNEVLDRIQNLSLSDGQTTVYDQIGCKTKISEKFCPTHHPRSRYYRRT